MGEPVELASFGPWEKAKHFITPTPVRIEGYDGPLAYGKHRFKIDENIAVCEACHMMIRSTAIEENMGSACTPIFAKDLGL